MKKNVIKLFLKGSDVPEWLDKQEPIKGFESEFKAAKITFGSMCFCWLYKGEYYLVKLGFFGCTINIKGGSYINLAGQRAGVHFYASLWQIIKSKTLC